MKKKRLNSRASCPCKYDELMEKYTAVCKERDELISENKELLAENEATASELHKSLDRERALVVANVSLRKTVKQIQGLVKKYEGEGGSL